MKTVLSYLSYLMFILSILEGYYFFDSFKFATSVCFLLMCIGCIFSIPKLYEDLKQPNHDSYWMRCKSLFIFMILGSIGFFILAIAFLPCFSL